MREIRISDGLYGVYLATETRWVERLAHIAVINGFEYSLVPEKSDWGISVVVSELSSGARVYTEWVDPFTFATCNTKEKTLVLLKEIAQNTALKIEKYDSDYFKLKIYESLEKTVGILGPMPENKVPHPYNEEL